MIYGVFFNCGHGGWFYAIVEKLNTLGAKVVFLYGKVNKTSNKSSLILCMVEAISKISIVIISKNGRKTL